MSLVQITYTQREGPNKSKNCDKKKLSKSADLYQNANKIANKIWHKNKFRKDEKIFLKGIKCILQFYFIFICIF